MRHSLWYQFLLPFLAGLAMGLLGIAQGDGIDLLAVQKPGFPAASIARGIPEGFAGGNLDHTFGSSLAAVRLFLDTGRVAAWRVHLSNGPCIRAGNCGRYEPYAGRSMRGFSDSWERGAHGPLRRHLVRRAKAYCSLFARYANAQLLISPTLEHNLSHRAFRQQAAAVKAACPAAVVVDNPAGGWPSTRGFVTERHGKRPGLKPPCVVSLDGELGVVDLKAFYAQNAQCLALSWTEPLNCRRSSGPFVDPRERRAKDCPSAGHVQRLLSSL